MTKRIDFIDIETFMTLDGDVIKSYQKTVSGDSLNESTARAIGNLFVLLQPYISYMKTVMDEQERKIKNIISLIDLIGDKLDIEDDKERRAGLKDSLLICEKARSSLAYLHDIYCLIDKYLKSISRTSAKQTTKQKIVVRLDVYDTTEEFPDV